MIEVEESSASLAFNERLDIDNMFVPVCVNVVGIKEIATGFTVELKLDEEFSTATLGEDIIHDVVVPGSNHPIQENSAPSTSIFIDFSPGQVMTSCGTMSILADDIMEGPETYRLKLHGTTPFEISINTEQDSVTVLIRNDPSGKCHPHTLLH